jgi:hypothetical protein
MNRRHFLLAAATVTTGCAGARQRSTSGRAPVARAPAVGQSWQYARHDALTGRILDTQISRVGSVGKAVQIESTSEAHKAPPRSPFNPLGLIEHSRQDTPARPLPTEIQEPWGMVLADPHWEDPLVFENPVPLWPIELRPGWSGHFHTRYETPQAASPRSWQLTMRAHEWETVTVPAGRFTSLRYNNLINFESSNAFKRSAQRRETVWFVPEIGRWAIRESQGTYYNQDSVDDQQRVEDAFRWELLDWS